MKNIILLVQIIAALFLPSNNITTKKPFTNYLRVPLSNQSGEKRQEKLLSTIYIAKMLGKEIKAQREKLGLSREELAIKIGATGKMQIENWEYGLSYPEQGFLQKLVSELKISSLDNIDSILSEKEIRKLIDSIGLSPEELSEKIGATGKRQIEAWKYGLSYPESSFLTKLQFLRDVKTSL